MSFSNTEKIENRRGNPIMQRYKTARLFFALLMGLLLSLCTPQQTKAYPEYQSFVEKNSKRSINCAMCHVNESGPVGNGPGQLSSLSEEDMKQLNKARVALEPASGVKSPILNDFGNKIINAVGKRKFLEYKSAPEKLAPALGSESDLDGDGIPDAQEYLDGTDPLNKFHGDPIRLFWINLNRYKTHVILTVLAVISINLGLLNLVKGISSIQKK
ncbi:hypothetical protein KA183_08965 [bacterium]|nr:hypothetical protein [bacterium]QQR56777.1 MAG: hypothetical protein IPG59_17510 [Candidatus Melainabacteria bacterium]